jgi:hypothetical protein
MDVEGNYRKFLLLERAFEIVFGLPRRDEQTTNGVSVAGSSLRKGRPTYFDYDTVKAKAFRLFGEKGLPDVSNDDGWRTVADLVRELAVFCSTVFGREPAKSTLEKLAKRVVKDWGLRQPEKSAR